MSIQVQFTEEDWERIERDWSAWWAGDLSRPLVLIEGLDKAAMQGVPEPEAFTSNYPMEMSADEVLDRYQPKIETTRYYGDAFPKWQPNYGPGIMAGFLGARVHSVPETVWFEPLEARKLEEIRIEHDDRNPWWNRIRDLTLAAVDRWGDNVAITHADLGGNLDILASLYSTEALLMALYDEPEQVMRLVDEITPLWIWYYEKLDAIIRRKCRGTTPWASIWSPQRCYMLQCDFAYMISPEMFERFVMPDLAACCEYLDHGFYHLDGKGQIPHLDLLLSLDRLRGIQWITGDGVPPPEKWIPLLKRIRDGGKLCQLYVTPEGALEIVRTLGGHGFAFSIWNSMSEDEATDFLKVFHTCS